MHFIKLSREPKFLVDLNDFFLLESESVLLVSFFRVFQLSKHWVRQIQDNINIAW